MIPIYAVAMAASFNLVCTGFESEATRGQQPQVHPLVVSLRVNLTSLRWCSEPCLATRNIVKVTDDRITLEETSLPESNKVTFLQREVGRYMSAFTEPAYDPKHAIVGSADCKTAPFSGFPAAKF